MCVGEQWFVPWPLVLEFLSWSHFLDDKFSGSEHAMLEKLADMMLNHRTDYLFGL